MDLSRLPATYAGRRVLVTGHTGFKGAWLCEWLLALGAEVHGFALPPEERSLFNALDLAGRLHHRVGDLRDPMELMKHVDELRPEFIFHLAAQALVRVSYREPAATFASNTFGTAHLLEAIRASGIACTAVMVTTDKVYSNPGGPRTFREEDALGGHDPYSASKAAAEIVIASYRDSFFASGAQVALASARAGNVIGGGDWALDRIVPDAIRALEAGRPVPVRNPGFTRPWQHVLEPVGAYLLLGAELEAARVSGDHAALERLATAFNFGPEPGANRTVRELVEEMLRHWPGTWEQVAQETHLPEAPLLSLDITRAGRVLGWTQRWDFARTVRETAAWYRAVQRGSPAREVTQAQIAEYDKQAPSRAG